LTGKIVLVTGPFFQPRPYDWAVCHAGWWIRHKRHYVWVSGTKRHHIDPVRWIKAGRTVAFVPIHPFDVKGRPAVNAKHEVFAVTGKNQFEVRPVKLDPAAPVKYLKDPPREYRINELRPLAATEAPRMEARAFSRSPALKPGEIARVPIHFDLKSQTFLVARQATQAGKPATVFVPMSNRTGTLQSRAGSFGGSTAFRGSTSSGSSAGFRGTGSSASTSHGGATSSGGGTGSSGAAHVSSTTSVSSPSSSSSSAASAASSSIHH
jgi:hypothetical protein